jgi:hypothetical protein
MVNIRLLAGAYTREYGEDDPQHLRLDLARLSVHADAAQ